MIDPRFSPQKAAIISKLSSNERVSSRFDLNRGLHAYPTDGYGKSKFGDGPQTKRDKDERSYHSLARLDQSYLPEIRGRDVGFFDYQTSGQFICYSEWLAEPRDERFMVSPKLLMRKTLGKRLSCALVAEAAAVDQALYIALGTPDDLLLLCGVMGSQFGAWYLRTRHAIYDLLHPWYTKDNLARFPLPRKDHDIAGKVTQILATRKKLATCKSAHERSLFNVDLTSDIDSLDEEVFDAYGLSKDEKSLIFSQD